MGNLENKGITDIRGKSKYVQILTFYLSLLKRKYCNNISR